MLIKIDMEVYGKLIHNKALMEQIMKRTSGLSGECSQTVFSLAEMYSLLATEIENAVVEGGRK
mgnify:CR=1 FL=1|tara:strand:+ start:4263 stop:4451 length:189 start_codon:yes stop_codon:yes gene_type:complete